MHQEEFTQLLNFYQGRGAASDQNELVQLLRETQARRRELLDFLSTEYGVEPGGVAAAGFRLQTGGCMKNCGKGPCVRWDGTVYTGMTPESLRALIEKK